MDWTKVQENFYDLKRVKVLIRPNCRKLPTIGKICIELKCRKIPTIWKMWIELTCRKIPTIWKIRIELNCRKIVGKIPTIWKEWKFFCGLGHIVWKFLRFEKSEGFIWWIKPNRRKIYTIWKMWIEPRCRKIPTIWKEWTFWFDQRCVLNWIIGKFLYLERSGFNYIVGNTDDLKTVKLLCGFDQIVGTFLQFEKCRLN